MCLILGIFGIALGVGLIQAETGDVVLIVAFWMYLAAILAAQMQIEVLVMPFSWCLPGHREEAGRLLFGMGTVFSCVWAGIFMLRPELDAAGGLGIGLSIFFMALGAYCLAAWMVFRFSNVAAAMLLALVGLTAGGSGIGRIFSTASGAGWLVGGMLGGVVCFFVWRTLDLGTFARRYCGVPTLRALDANPQRVARFTAVSKSDGINVWPGVERFFLGRIRAGRGTAPYVWGNLYTHGATVKAMQPKHWLFGMLVWLGLACYFGYKIETPANFLFVLPAVFVVQMPLCGRSSLLICGGRSERFWSALILAVVASLLTTCSIVLIAGATMLVQAIVPELTIRGENMIFRAMDMNYIVVPLAIVPSTLTVGQALCNYPRLALGAQMLLLFAAISCFDVLTDHLVIAAGIAAACWGLFVGVLRYVCVRGSLVSHA